MEQNQPFKKRIVEQPFVRPLERKYVKTLSSQHPRPQQYYVYAPISETKPLQPQHQQLNQQQHDQQHDQQHEQQHEQQHQQQYQQHHQQQHIQQPLQQQQIQYQQQHQQHLQQPQYAQQQQHAQQQHAQQQYHQQEPERNQSQLLQQPLQTQQQIVHYEYIERPMTLNAWTQTKAEDFPRLPPSQQEIALLAKVTELEKCLKVQFELINQLQEESRRTPSPPQAIPNSTTITPTTVKHEGTRYRILAQADEATSEAQIEIELSEEAMPSNLNLSTDSDRLEICLSDETESSPRTPTKSEVTKKIQPNPERPDLENATVSIGPNGTRIPVSEYETMSWVSPSLATRKLLTLIFGRKILATHSMTGKASPAFKDLGKPIKGQLEPNAVKDIIYIVSNKCKVSQKEVRAAITTKCADDNKVLKLQTLKQVGTKRSALTERNGIKSENIPEKNA